MNIAIMVTSETLASNISLGRPTREAQVEVLVLGFRPNTYDVIMMSSWVELPMDWFRSMLVK